MAALPSEGYSGEVPDFPLPPKRAKALRDRELAVWVEAWATPQACAWALEPWRWPVIAEYCRVKTAVELAPVAPAALVGQLHRYRDQIGLTPAGLRENGWAVASDEVAAKAADEAEVPRKSSRDRIRVIHAEGG